MRCILGVDGSAGSVAAVQTAARILSAEREQVFLYYSPPHISVRRREHPDPQLLQGAKDSLAKAVFDKSEVELGEPFRGRIQTIQGSQSPAHGLLVAADECRADMIVVGSRGSGPMHELRLGSVARSVVHHATVPVLVVRPSGRGQAEPLRVLLTTDGSEPSKHACDFIRNVSWPDDTRGFVITVIESLLAGHMPQWLEEELSQQEVESMGLGHFERSEDETRIARDELARWTGGLPSIFHEQEPLVAVGHASLKILDAIRNESIDLAIVGARGLGPIGRLLLGSTSEHLLTHAPCSLLIVRQHEKP